MNMPNNPPMPNPITPDMTLLVQQFSMKFVICAKGVRRQHSRFVTAASAAT